MVLNTFQELKDAVAAGKGQRRLISKPGLNVDVAMTPSSLTGADGFPAIWATPATGAGTSLDRNSAGAIFLANPNGLDNSYILRFGANCGQNGYLILMDYLVASSGLSGTVATAQTVNSVALPRYTTGEGVWLGLYCTTATGTTVVSVTASYTNQDGTAGKITQSVQFWQGGFGSVSGAAPIAHQIQWLPLAPGDYGVRSVQSVTLTATTGTAGSFGIILAKPLAMLGARTGESFEKDFALQLSTLPDKQDSAFIALCAVLAGTATGTTEAVIETVEG